MKKSSNPFPIIMLAMFIPLVAIAIIFNNQKRSKADKEAEKSAINAPTMHSKEAESQLSYQIGDQAEDFALKNIDGKNVSLKDYKNAKGYIVTFTCNHCPYAKMYEGRITALHKTFETLGYPVIAINPNDPALQPDDSFENMQARAKEKNYAFAYLFDETQAIAQKFGATKTPHVFILDNTLKVRYIGAIDDNAQDAGQASKFYVANALKELQKGEPVSVPTTKAVGCSIKWKQ